jgi:hypothetical protein
MDDKAEVNENESRRGEVNDKETKSKRYMQTDYIFYIITIIKSLMLRIDGTLQ